MVFGNTQSAHVSDFHELTGSFGCRISEHILRARKSQVHWWPLMPGFHCSRQPVLSSPTGVEPFSALVLSDQYEKAKYGECLLFMIMKKYWRNLSGEFCGQLWAVSRASNAKHPRREYAFGIPAETMPGAPKQASICDNAFDEFDTTERLMAGRVPCQRTKSNHAWAKSETAASELSYMTGPAHWIGTNQPLSDDHHERQEMSNLVTELQALALDHYMNEINVQRLELPQTGGVHRPEGSSSTFECCKECSASFIGIRSCDNTSQICEPGCFPRDPKAALGATAHPGAPVSDVVSKIGFGSPNGALLNSANGNSARGKISMHCTSPSSSKDTDFRVCRRKDKREQTDREGILAARRQRNRESAARSQQQRSAANETLKADLRNTRQCLVTLKTREMDLRVENIELKAMIETMKIRKRQASG